MIDRQELEAFVEEQLKESGYFLTDLKVSPSNEIVVEIDSDCPGDIDECVKLTRAIESKFDRDVEDYELEVGTAGLTSPLKVKRQYEKYIGKDLEVLTCDGKKLRGLLKRVSDDGISIAVQHKVKKEGSKRPIMESEDIEISFNNIKKAVYDLKF